MGQAKLRGTRDERVAVARAAITVAEAIRDEADRKREQARAAKWAAMTPEQKAAALEKAKREAEAYGFLSAEFGHDAARLLLTM